MSVPNMYQVVAECANRWPREFKVAHTDHPDKHLWIKLLAWELHKLDPRWGLNGKRGNPNDLSMDAINWLGEGIGFDPTRNDKPVTVVDVIGAAGGPDPKPTWQVLNDPTVHRGPGAWVQPKAVEGYQTNVPPKPPEPEPPPVSQADVLNALVNIANKLNAVIESNERVAKAVQEVKGKIEQLDDTTSHVPDGFIAAFADNVNQQEESNAALKASVDGLNERFDRGFTVEGKAGWPVGKVNATINLRNLPD